MIRALFLTILLSSLPVALSACRNDEQSAAAVNVRLLSTDIYVLVAQHTLALPFIALDDFAYQKQSFSLDRRGDSERAQNALAQILHKSADPKAPLAIDSLSVVVRTYGWNDADMRQRQMCPLLTRKWAQAVCDNPWAAIQQALPVNRFRLVDLRRLQIRDSRSPANCRNDGNYRPLPQKTGEAVMVCAVTVNGGRDDQYHHAVVRIDGDLGALWTVWRYGQNGETAEAMTEREGKAIVSFVRYALAERENYPALHADMCRLRRPGSVDGPHSADCGRVASPPSRNHERSAVHGSAYIGRS